MAKLILQKNIDGIEQPLVNTGGLYFNEDKVLYHDGDTNNVIDLTSSGDVPKPTYVAILANFATNNPTVTTLINTFGEVPTWQRIGTGQYGLTFLVGNPLVDGKTSVIVSAWNSAGKVYNAARYSGTSVIIESFNFSGVASDGISVIIEIIVYP